MEESISSLTEKQVINLCDGRVLGYVVDFKVEICSGNITAIILPGESGIFGFKKCEGVVIPWDKICRIGKDAIIVDIPPIEKRVHEKGKSKKKFFC